MPGESATGKLRTRFFCLHHRMVRDVFQRCRSVRKVPLCAKPLVRRCCTGVKWPLGKAGSRPEDAEFRESGVLEEFFCLGPETRLVQSTFSVLSLSVVQLLSLAVVDVAGHVSSFGISKPSAFTRSWS
jgi:hypothetical protein